MKCNFKIFAVAIVASITFCNVILTSCSKEESQSIMQGSSSCKSGVEIPRFNSREEVEAAIAAAISFDSISDLIDFEQRQGRNSIGAIADVFYERINTDSFQDENDVISFFRNHKDVLDTIMVNGEVSIMPKWSNTPYRYVANENGMFAVSDRYYRLFKTGTVSTTEEYVNDLTIISDDYDLTSLDTSIFRYIPDKESNIDTRGCITKWEQANNPTSLDDRIHIVLVTNTQNWPNVGDVAVTYVKVYNLHKWAGVWWTSRRNLFCAGTVNLHIKAMSGSNWVNINRSIEKQKKANVMWVNVYEQPCYWVCVTDWDILFNRYYKYYHYDSFSIDAWYPGHAVENFSR